MRRKQTKAYIAFRTLSLAIFLVIALFPIYWIVITSFKPVQDSVSVPIQYWPKNFTTQNYSDVMRLTMFPTFFKNSLIISMITGIVSVAVSVFAAYPLARFKFKGSDGVSLLLLITQMVPVIVLIVPLFIMFTKMGIINTHMSLIIPYIVMAIPFCTMMLVGFFKQIPYALEEAANIDGCTRLQALFKIVIPVMLPGIVSTFVFAFIGAWNELFFGVMFINSETLKTIPVGISAFIQKVDVNWAMMTAAAAIAMVPVLAMFFFVQKYLIKGLTAGAVKG